MWTGWVLINRQANAALQAVRITPHRINQRKPDQFPQDRQAEIQNPSRDEQHQDRRQRRADTRKIRDRVQHILAQPALPTDLACRRGHQGGIDGANVTDTGGFCVRITHIRLLSLDQHHAVIEPVHERGSAKRNDQIDHHHHEDHLDFLSDLIERCSGKDRHQIRIGNRNCER